MYSELSELLAHGTTTPGFFQSYIESYERAVNAASPGLWWVKLPNCQTIPPGFNNIPLFGLLFAKRISIVCAYVQQEGLPEPRVECRVYVTGIETCAYEFYIIWPLNKTTPEDLRELGSKIILQTAKAITFWCGRAGYKRVVRETDQTLVINGERL